ncbi:MAG: DUF1349 domain-containing protein [Ignavibacteria bacterium]|nr:DUF1349 domain-containing protein [Ignavibacteria bacterium]
MNRPRFLTAVILFLLPFAASLAQGFDDEFNSLVMQPGWTLTREDRAHWRFTGAEYQITTQPGALNGPTFNNVRNMLLQPSPPGFRMETKLDFLPDSAFHNAGLMYWVDDDNYVRVSRGLWVQDSFAVNGVWLEWELNALADFQFLDGIRANPIYLRLAKTGTLYEGSYSTDGITWTTIASTRITGFPAEVGKVGLQAANGDGTLATKHRIPATFDWFHIITVGIGDTPPVTAVSPRILDVFPNPASATDALAASIDAAHDARASLQLSDMLGRVVWSSAVLSPGAQTVRIPTAGLARGQYLLRLLGGAATSARLLRIN